MYNHEVNREGKDKYATDFKNALIYRDERQYSSRGRKKKTLTRIHRVAQRGSQKMCIRTCTDGITGNSPLDEPLRSQAVSFFESDGKAA